MAKNEAIYTIRLDDEVSAVLDQMRMSLEGAIRRIKALESESEPEAPEPLWDGSHADTMAELRGLSYGNGTLESVLDRAHDLSAWRCFAAVAVELARENARLRAGDE